MRIYPLFLLGPGAPGGAAGYQALLYRKKVPLAMKFFENFPSFSPVSRRRGGDWEKFRKIFTGQVIFSV
jgi:hypothetical protein